MSEWISVETRMPEIGQRTRRTNEKLAYCPFVQKTFMACYNSEERWEHFMSGNNLPYEVSHWMELPPPPL